MSGMQFKLLLPGSYEAVKLAVDKLEEARKRWEASNVNGVAAIAEAKAADAAIGDAEHDLDKQFKVYRGNKK
jgi:hypothetical protein